MYQRRHYPLQDSYHRGWTTLDTHHDGGCLCGKIRYRVNSSPVRVTICHCKFCQRATGSAFLVEPIFAVQCFELLQGQPKLYTQVSESSGKGLTVNFCAECGTKLFNRLERLPDIVPVYGGTFDDPDWFDRSDKIARHIFFSFAQKGTLIPANYEIYFERAILDDGTKAKPTVFDKPYQVG